jgi:hypothetical protein
VQCTIRIFGSRLRAFPPRKKIELEARPPLPLFLFLEAPSRASIRAHRAWARPFDHNNPGTTRLTETGAALSKSGIIDLFALYSSLLLDCQLFFGLAGE